MSIDERVVRVRNDEADGAPRNGRVWLHSSRDAGSARLQAGHSGRVSLAYLFVCSIYIAITSTIVKSGT